MSAWDKAAKTRASSCKRTTDIRDKVELELRKAMGLVAHSDDAKKPAAEAEKPAAKAAVAGQARAAR